MNMLCGGLAVILALSNTEFLWFASVLVITASVFDFLDGFSARLLKAYSPMGKELDSLADIISFGFAPAVICAYYFSISFEIDLYENFNFNSLLLLIVPVSILIFSGLRLAKFNIDDRQTTNFIGMPTPANALFWVSLPLIEKCGYFETVNFLTSKTSIILLIVLTDYLLISEIKMFSLKFKNLTLRDNIARYIFIAVTIIGFVLFDIAGLTFSILSYVLISLLMPVIKK